jgi:anaerobic selenocysteine-containing dehydrogenase
VSWDVALSAVSERIQATIDTHGRESLLLYDYPGNTGLLAWHFAKRLWFALGATTTDYALCSSSGHTGIGLHYGLSYGLQLTEMAASKVILFWGNNAKVTDKVLTGTLWAPRPLTGLNGVPLNALVPGTSQGIGGGPIFNSVKVKIKRVAGFSGNGESERSAGMKGK